jgi:DNA-binding GntR family transcriptional regulator
VRYQFHVSLLPGRLAQGAKEHLDIIDAVILGDPVAAERITREHFAHRRRLSASARGCGDAVDPAGGLGRSRSGNCR